ncbi:mitochondrial membrane protein [Spiromyces aspiralis]|uniref:Mitochondrial membrane protein n=1 Tax=Spiromyces aspiralis TaxID=68401 RepID=A0ACC1HVR1_9FUNG|nr:mitochondrial membrane protein [Spiromyces aspiralis]
MNDKDLPHAVDAETPLSRDELEVLRRQYEREHPTPSVQSKFNYAWGLVKSNDKKKSELGVKLLVEIFEQHPDRQRECLYYIALGYYKLGEYLAARRYNDTLLSMEPNNKQCLSLRKLIDDRVARAELTKSDRTTRIDGIIGMAIAGGAVAAVAGMIAMLLRSKKR